MAKKRTKGAHTAADKGKIFIVATYFLAVLSLMAGLFAPLYDAQTGAGLAGRLMIKYLPSDLSDVLYPFTGRTLFADLPWFINAAAGRFDVFALLRLILALLTVLSLIFIIPVCAGKRRTSARAAFFIEIAGALVSSLYLALNLLFISLGLEKTVQYNVLIVTFGCIAVAAAQAIFLKGRVAVFKTVGVVIWLAAALVLTDVATVIPPLISPINSLSTSIGLSPVFIAQLPTAAHPLYVSAFQAYRLKELLSGFGILQLAVFLLILALNVIVAFNLFAEIAALCAGRKRSEKGRHDTNYGGNIFALLRYATAFLLAATLTAVGILYPAYAPGLYLYALDILLTVALLCAILRLALCKVKAPKSIKKSPATAANEKRNESANTATEPQIIEHIPEKREQIPAEPITLPPTSSEPIILPPPAPAPPALPTVTPAEEDVIITTAPEQTNYDEDNFVKTLNDGERAEFYDVFIERSQKETSCLPEFVPGEDNSDFFLSVFVHLNRMRDICSDALLDKIYAMIKG